jgi:ectoine hydroxylase-related dioxygenase (phytanoyl-CoA dioxygenase family)
MRFSREEWAGLAGQAELAEPMRTALQSVGYLILENVIPDAKVAALYAEFERLLNEHRAQAPSNRGQNRYNIAIPAEGVFADPEIVANELVLPVLRDLLGDGLAVDYLAADTPLPGSDYQKAHSDGRPLFAEAPVTLPGYAYVLNIPLVDFRLDNGPLEIWPNGSHAISGVSAADGSRHYPAQQVLMPAGSLLVRDNRMWHRGTPNNSPGMRPNLAVVYTRSWYRFGQANVGMMPPRVSAAAWNSWSPEMQRLFRFADVEGGLNRATVLACVPNELNTASRV